MQEKILAEIDCTLTEFNGEICYEALQQMSYLEASLYGDTLLIDNSEEFKLK